MLRLRILSAERGAGVVILDPAAELREDGTRHPAVPAVHVIPFEGLHEGLAQAIALRAVCRHGDRDQAQLVGVEHGSRSTSPWGTTRQWALTDSPRLDDGG